ncbi:MAG: acetate--CoA ligase family protein [Janthinobacterium lividum]
MSNSLTAALNPRSVAIVGASESPDKIGGRCLSYMKRFGFTGAIYPINPSRDVTMGVKTYPSLDALPEPAELVVVCVPGEQAVAAVESCARLGTKIVIIITAGFGEAGEAGRAMEASMVATARAVGMRLIGPNTQGLANSGNGAIPNFSTMFIEAEPEDGPVAIVSQSGGMGSVPFGLLRQMGVGVRHCHSIGNGCDVTVSELAVEVARDPGVKLLLLYLEGVPDPENLGLLGKVARERGLPVLVLKGGRTPAGQIASLSHTGSLAAEDRVVDAFLRHHGLYRVGDVGGLVDAAELYLKGWKSGGRRLVVISNSGTACVLSADAATRHGLPIETLRPETRAELGTILPGFATTTNPVDITAALLSNSRLFGDILPVIARDPGADCFLISVPVAGRGYDVPAFAEDAAAFGRTVGKPLVIVTPQPGVAARFKAQGLPVFRQESEAVAALSQFIAHHELMAAELPAPYVVPAAGSGVARTLNEADSLALLARQGVTVVPHRLCGSADAAVEAFIAFGGAPVAVKGCTGAVTHKTELGLVRLGLGSADAVREAYRDVEAAAMRHGVALDGVLVAGMVGSVRRELIVGAHRDPTFGPVIVVGDGGKYVEALPDSCVLLPGTPRAAMMQALRGLRIFPILAGVRGEAPIDLDEICDLAEAVGRCMTDEAAGISSVDINPVMVLENGRGCVAVDGVVVCH